MDPLRDQYIPASAPSQCSQSQSTSSSNTLTGLFSVHSSRYASYLNIVYVMYILVGYFDSSKQKTYRSKISLELCLSHQWGFELFVATPGGQISSFTESYHSIVSSISWSRLHYKKKFRNFNKFFEFLCRFIH